MPELSIIVPVYNVAPYLSRCIDSILAQQYEDYELILVNDGSTDLSGDIIKAYASREKRIITISQEKRGVSSARNKGLQAATGNYVSFIDADDWIDEDMYITMIQCMKDSKADIVCCNWKRNFENGYEENNRVNNCEGLMTGEEFVCHIFDSPRSFGGSIWNKLFLREKINHDFDESLRVCEDNLFLLQYCSHIDKAFYVNASFYHIYERNNSTTRGTILLDSEVLPVRERLVVIASTTGTNARNAAERDYLDQCYYFLKNNTDTYVYKQLKRRIRNYCRKYAQRIILNKFISWRLKIIYFLI